MFGILALLFIIVPIIEIYVLVQVADGLGWLNSLGLIVVLSVLGAWLVKQQGFGILRRMNEQIADHKMPSNELVDGGLVLFAGALMLTPGFVTDAVGFFLLLPPTRALVRPPLVRRLKSRVVASPAGQSPIGQWWFTRGGGAGPGGSGPHGSGPVYDVPSSPTDPTDGPVDG
ncbi:MAG: FxsA family protein, partial [Acidimicrobiales bacterium]|nr:FxsA family protein [Acidimicrobiales bacterium]